MASASGEPFRVLVTGAAGQIAYSLIFMIARGNMFGPTQKVILHLLDIPPMADKVAAVEMELDDLASPLVAGVVATTDVAEAFAGVQYACLVGARPRGPGMARKDLLSANAGIFREQGAALEAHADRDVKVLVVGNPANTNCLIAMTSAPSIPRENFTALTRLDQNRAKAQIAKRLSVPVSQVQSVVIWGNHSASQYPDVRHATVVDGDSASGVPALVGDQEWLQGEFIKTIQTRGAAVIKARGSSSASSAASAICDHMHDWILGSDGQIVSMGVVSDGSPYDVTEDLIFSMPVICEAGGKYKIVSLELDDFSKGMLKATESELIEEKAAAFA